jgi:integrase
MPKITTTAAAGKAGKPRPDFPLFAHQRGYWCKKVRGQLRYFGKVADDPKGKAALELWLTQRDDLLAGRAPRTPGDGLTVRDLCNRFLSVKEASIGTREITQRHFDNLYTACELIVGHFGKTRLVDDLATEDFESLRMSLAKTRAAWALGGTVAKIRSVFKYAYEAALIDKPTRYGPNFKRPGRAALRRERNDKPLRLFRADELRQIIEAADCHLKAMILLGINCGLGNADCGQLKFHNLDMINGWLNYPRPKTGIDRRCPLWKETLAALKSSIDGRTEPKDVADQERVFITKYGQPWFKDAGGASSLGHEFRKLLKSLDLRRDGLSFYTLRHTFATEAGNNRDQVAVNCIMGHADHTMADHYRERIDDDRLLAVTNHVRQWLWPLKRKRKAR